MKILIFGDIHGRLEWYHIVQQEKPDLTIFLGDYVGSHENILADQECANLEDIMNFKQEYPDNVILLRGNHDLQHLGYYWAECSGLRLEVEKWMSSSEIKSKFLELSRWVYIYNDLIFSHAGIGKPWFNKLNLGEPTKENILKINELEPSELFGFTPNRYSDWSGTSPTQPLTWIRPHALIENAIDGWNQVVGHTKLKTPGNVINNPDIQEFIKNNNIKINECWFIDAMPNQYMIIDDDIREMRTNNLIYNEN